MTKSDRFWGFEICTVLQMSDFVILHSQEYKVFRVEILDVGRIHYSLRPILPSANTDVSSTKIYLDTSVFAKGNMDRRE
jgi:hypothetical protein